MGETCLIATEDLLAIRLAGELTDAVRLAGLCSPSCGSPMRIRRSRP